MISLVQGKVIENNKLELVVLTYGGVGYKIFIKPTAIDDFKIGDEVKIITYLVVREGIMDLYGFETNEEKELFMHFLNVSGIGPKSALHLLSLGSVAEIRNAISNGDVDYLTKVSGVGKRTAERIVVELKEKMGAIENVVGVEKMLDSLSDVMDALIAMGYSAQQARDVVKKLDSKDKSSEDLIREALRGM